MEKIKAKVKSYKVVDLTEGAFASPHFVEANSPKAAAEIITGNKVKRVTKGGNIVVYGCSHNRNIIFIKSFVYEFDNE